MTAKTAAAALPGGGKGEEPSAAGGTWGQQWGWAGAHGTQLLPAQLMPKVLPEPREQPGLAAPSSCRIALASPRLLAARSRDNPKEQMLPDIQLSPSRWVFL